MKVNVLNTNNRKSRSPNEDGIATVESVLLLSIFVVFFTYYLGFFGVVHTGILNSISARGYAFETFRNRTNLMYLRDSGDLTQTSLINHGAMGFRLHGVVTEKVTGSDQWRATTRQIAQGRDVDEVREGVSSATPNQTLAREDRKVNPVFIKTTYGICLNKKCGGS